jgi:hypothetical protein
VPELFHFNNIALSVPSADIDGYLKAHSLPEGFDPWKARTLLALISLVGGRALSVTTVGGLDSMAAWLQGFGAMVRASAPPGPPSEAVSSVALLAVSSTQADSAQVQDIFAGCVAGIGPDALFITNSGPIQVEDTTQSFTGGFRALSAAGYLLLHDGYFSAWMRARTPELRLHALTETQPVATVLQSRMLFIIGHARSGTSALFELMNYHPELLLLFESNSFLPRMRRNFAENFSSRMAAVRPAIRKGYFCAPPVSGPDHPFTVLPALLEHYRLVGEKIALSPRENPFVSCPVALCLNYYAQHFPFAKYIFLARTPFEATEALRRILPRADLAEILRLYAAYMAGMIQFQSVLPSSRVLFMEDFEHLNSAALNRLVGLDILSDNVTLSPDRRTTRQSVPAPDWSALDYELRAVHDLYTRTRLMFSTNDYEIRGDVDLSDFEALVVAWKAAAAGAAELAFATKCSQ